MKLACIGYKAHNNMLPVLVRDIFSKRNVTTTMSLRQVGNIEIKFNETNYENWDLNNQDANIWNKLNYSTKNSTYKKFTQSVKQLISENKL